MNTSFTCTPLEEGTVFVLGACSSEKWISMVTALSVTTTWQLSKLDPADVGAR